jgi:hypothetical protein
MVDCWRIVKVEGAVGRRAAHDVSVVTAEAKGVMIKRGDVIKDPDVNAFKEAGHDCCKSPQRGRQDKMRCNRLRISIPSRPNSENLRALRNILAGEAALLILASSHNERRAIPTRMAYDEPTPHLTEFKQGGYLVRSQPPLNVELAEPRQTDCGSSSPGQCSLQRYR